jgi:hypothetical protein
LRRQLQRKPTKAEVKVEVQLSTRQHSESWLPGYS